MLVYNLLDTAKSVRGWEADFIKDLYKWKGILF